MCEFNKYIRILAKYFTIKINQITPIVQYTMNCIGVHKNNLLANMHGVATATE